MTVLLIYKLDSGDVPVSTLRVGQHIFGRGDLLKCDDRRVSRNHGIIQVTDAEATITSTHQNPCFYQTEGSSTITILPKDKAVTINNGDKFALLADQYWFVIKILVNDHNTNDTPSSSINNPGQSIVENNLDNVTNDSNSMDCLEANGKRPLEDQNDSVLLKSKRVKHDDVQSNNSPPRNNNETEIYDNEKETVLHQRLSKQEQLSDSEENEDPEPNEKKEMLSESEEESRTKAAKSKTSSTRKKKMKPDSAAHDAELKAMLFSSDEEPDVADNNENKKASTNENESDKKINDSLNDPKDAVDTNSASTSRANDKKRKRERCWYATSCFRKNPAHLAEFSHPGDSDFGSDPEDDRPTCSYGAACYRRNKDHRQAYKHPNKPQKRRGKKKNAKGDNNTVPNKKRTARKNYNEDSSEDDYDLQDPFINDSGSEYEISGSSDDDSDTEWSGGSDEETKRLLKEAKRFTKNKTDD